jgi:mono/diheme cytochrome c family protein
MKKILLGVSAILGLVVLAGYGQTPQGQGKAQTQAFTPEAQKAFFGQYCQGCHNDRAKVGGMSLEKIDMAKVADHAETLELVVRKVRAGMMPPAGMKRPEAPVLEAFVSSVERSLDRAVAATLPPPGLHRLNRTEYTNVVRDLLGLEVDASKFLPSDDSTRGFDNVAAALNMSPALLEGYVSAAGKIARLAMGSASAPSEAVFRVPEDTSQDYHIEGLPFGTRGGMIVNYEFPADGEYAIKITPISKGNMGNTNPFGEIPGEKLEFLLDGERLKVFEWDRERARADGTFNFRFSATAGAHTVGVTYQATNYAPGNDLNQHFLRSTIETGGLPGYRFFPHVGKVVVNGPFNAKGTADSPSRRKILACKPTTPAQEAACARQILSTLARRAYRRPVNAADTETLMGFYQRGRNTNGSFDNGIEMALRRVLADPEFIFRKETEPANVKPGQKYRISDLELASRLSFFLWSSIPDDPLLTLASQNKLRDAAVLEQQVKRMLADPKSDQMIVNITGQWLGNRALAAQVPVTALYPDWDDNLRQAMRRELDLFVQSIVREDRPLTDLLDGNVTFLNERLAKHYGIPNVYGMNFRRVELGPEFDMRRGLLGKGSLMATSSQPGRTSPVQRGKTVMQIFLGVEPPAPPPDVPVNIKAVDARSGPTQTMREQMEEHRANPVCNACHKIMDPIGLALENFDAVGAYRTQEAGKPIDLSTQLTDGEKIVGLPGLRGALLRYSPQFVRIATEKLLIYGLGRGTEYYDMPLVRSIVRDAERDNYRFSAFVLGVVKSEPFQSSMKVPEAAEHRASR